MAPFAARRRYAGLAAVALAACFAIAVTLVPQPSSSAIVQETVRLERGTAVALATPPFIQTGKRYAFTWPGGGPPQTYTIKSVRPDGWVEVQVAEENVDPAFLVPGQTPTRWLHAGIAVSVQEMRPLPY
jgi:hypothetical protein